MAALIEKAIVGSFKGAAIGVALGAAGGIYARTALNDYAHVLKEAPTILQYSTDATAAIVGAGAGAFIGGVAAGGLTLLVNLYTKNRAENQKDPEDKFRNAGPWW